MSSMKGKQEEQLDFVGRFELPNDPSVFLDGMVRRERDRLYLRTSPTFISPLPSDALRRSLGQMETEERWDVLHGRTSEGLCSLLFTQPRQNPSSSNFSEGYSVGWSEYSVNSVLSGIHLESTKEPLITGARLEFEQLRPWLKQNLRLSKTDDEITVSLSRLSPAFLDFSAVPSGLRLELEAESILNWNNEQGAKFDKEVVVRLTCRNPISYVEFTKIETRIQDFLSVLMGIPITASTVQVKCGDENGFLFRRKVRERPELYLPIWVHPDAVEIANAWSAWLQLGNQLEPFERLLYGTVQNSEMFVETEFQALVQSLEAFHRLTQNGRFTAKERVRNLLVRLQPNNSQSLVGDIEAFIDVAVDTRDVLVHPGISKPNAIQDVKERFLLNQKMHALLRLLVLKHLGMAEQHAIQPCVNQASRYS